MKAHTASLINAIVLIAMGFWGYMETVAFGKMSTALIPVIVGIVLLVLNKGLKKENKIIAHIAVLLTALMVFGLIKPLSAALADEPLVLVKLFRVLMMLLTTFMAIIAFIRSFKEARRNRES